MSSEATKRIWLSSPHMCGMEQQYVEEAFQTNWIAPLGPHVDGFEKDIESYLGEGVKVAALTSGTAAIHLALVLLNVNAGDEVICQSFTFSASANPIIYQGATPVFVDSEEDTWNISPEHLEAAIKERIKQGKKPKAIIVVHLYGMPAKIEDIAAIAQQYGIALIEDAAEALGATYKGQCLGTFGDFGILSFNGNKIITTSGGGALVSKRSDWISKARFLATQARDNAIHYQHSEIGYNYRLSNVCAGIGRGQMQVLGERIQQRRNNFQFYKQSLIQHKKIDFLEEPTSDYFSNRWLTTVTIDNTNINKLVTALDAVQIDARPLWKPMHLQPVFMQYPYYGNGESEILFNKGLCLPSGSNLTQDELNKVVHHLQALM